ncbi:MAG: dephospho-CoA kinase [Bacteroidales bacterium]|nr:dephospho-CoA kinase [Clostridium sp.]MCM1203078.1 dephospho-CoA kinase [Bacteroidales bacterium]
MRVVGITGGIGTGKSTLLKLLNREHGAYIIEADKLAHKLMLPGGNLHRRIVEAFGERVLREDKTIDRQILSETVFRNEDALKKLNGIVHPEVKAYINADIAGKREEGKVSLYVIEAALLIEDGYREICDELWYVWTEKEERIKRLIEGRGGSREKWEKIMANQSSDTYYQENCDVIIDNGGNSEKTAGLVKELLSKSI